VLLVEQLEGKSCVRRAPDEAKGKRWSCEGRSRRSAREIEVLEQRYIDSSSYAVGERRKARERRSRSNLFFLFASHFSVELSRSMKGRLEGDGDEKNEG
jgi:hypothetical protein